MVRILKKNHSLNVLCFIAIVCLEILFFKNILFTDQLIGGAIDGRLNNYFMEHWYRVFSGIEKWTEQNCFYPITGVAGYSDLMLGFGIPYSLCRWIGLDMYLSYNFILVCTHVVGSLFLFRFMRIYIKVDHISALLSVVVFSYSNMYFLVTDTPQMFALSYMPISMCAIAKYMNTKRDCLSRHVWMLIGISILSLSFYTAFYVGYMVCLWMGFFVLIFLLYGFLVKKNQCWVVDIFHEMKYRMIELGVYLIVFMLSLIPFVYLYLPQLKNSGGRTWEEVMLFLPTWKGMFMQEEALSFDPVTVGKINVRIGFPVVAYVIFVILVILGLKKVRDQQKKYFYMKLLLLVLVVTFLLPFRVEEHSLWYFIYKYVPGASGIRGVLRWEFILTLPISILMGMCAGNMSIQKRTLRYIICGCFVVVVFVANFSLIGIDATWNRKEEIAFLDSVPTPPNDCEVFFVITNEEDKARNEGSYQMDSWAIANKYKLHTINGYSGMEPKDWAVKIYAEDVKKEALRWMNDNNLSISSMYMYNLSSHEWLKVEE